jgi:outer membrane usher protein FimD/PapC
MSSFLWPLWPVWRPDRHATTRAGLLLAASVGLGNAWASDASLGFDAEVLRQRGIDPRLAEYFSGAARFTPGEHRVKLKVNAKAVGNVLARFDDRGALCFDARFIEAARLLPLADREGNLACSAFIERYPLTRVQVQPNLNEVELVVPDEGLAIATRDVSGFTSGGAAGVVNYEVFGLSSRHEGGTSRSTSAKTEAGFNAGDWIVRSNQLYTDTNGVARSQHINAYAQRTFAAFGSVLQVGQIQMTNPVLGGARISGVQIASEHGLAQQRDSAHIEGVAQSAARVEVRQGSTLIHTTVVPAGPFVLRDVQRINQRTALEVTVIEADGSRHGFSVSAAQAGINPPPSGYVLGMGQLRTTGSGNEGAVASAGWTGGLGLVTRVSAGATLADHYRALGSSISQPWWPGAQASADLVATQSARSGASGLQSRLALSQILASRWTLDGSLTQQTEGYRELLDFDDEYDGDRRSRIERQWNAGLSWSQEQLGSLSASYAESMAFDGTRSRRASASWSRNIGKATFSLTAERDLSPRRPFDDQFQQRTTGGTSLYASISVPLGERRRLHTSYSDSQTRRRVSTTFSDAPTDVLNYRVGVERQLDTGREGFTGNLSLIPRYTQLDLGYSGDGAAQHSVNAGLRGGLVVHEAGITPSAYPVGETFALVKVGEVPGVKVSTSSGPAWTDAGGRAVVPRLGAFKRNTIELVPKSLPRNMDLANGVYQVTSGRGAVERIDFDVHVTRRVLLQVTTDEGARLPAGAAVVDEQQIPHGLVAEDGSVFLANAGESTRLWISSPYGSRCELLYELPKHADSEVFYETVPATCHTP